MIYNISPFGIREGGEMTLKSGDYSKGHCHCVITAGNNLVYISYDTWYLVQCNKSCTVRTDGRNMFPPRIAGRYRPS